MAFVRIATERLLLVLFWIARSAFLAFTLAVVTALVAAGTLGGPAAPAWLGTLTRACLLIGATCLVALVLLLVAPSLRAPAAGASDETPPWIWPLGLTLLALPAVVHARSADLAALWREILALLDGMGFWEALAQPQPYAGLVIFPVLAALFLPALETVAACFLIVAPLLLLLLLPTRSRLFPHFFAMLVVCQAALVLASTIAADAFSHLAAELIAAMNASGDIEVQRGAEALGRASGVLTATAHTFAAPTLGYLVWLPVLLASRRVAAFFDAGAMPAPEGASRWTPTPPPSERPVAPPAPEAPAVLGGRREGEAAATPARPRARRARVGLVVLGSLILVSAAGQMLRPRARYAASDPAPGATLASAPAAVRVSFGREIGPSSQLWVDRTTPGEGATRVGASSGLDPGDPRRRTLVAELSDGSSGLYQVTWLSQPPSGGVGRSGSFRFGVGMPVPAAGGESPLQERDAGWRAQRKTLAGGVLLVLLGALLPRLPRAR